MIADNVHRMFRAKQNIISSVDHMYLVYANNHFFKIVFSTSSILTINIMSNMQMTSPKKKVGYIVTLPNNNKQ